MTEGRRERNEEERGTSDFDLISRWKLAQRTQLAPRSFFVSCHFSRSVTPRAPLPDSQRPGASTDQSQSLFPHSNYPT